MGRSQDVHQTIYMIEVNADHQKVLQQHFAAQKQKLVCFTTPDSLEQAVARQSSDIAGFILPISMSRVNGLDLTHRLRQKYRVRGPILCLSRQTNAQILAACHKAGGNDVLLQVPFLPDQIIARITYLLSQQETISSKDLSYGVQEQAFSGDALVLRNTHGKSSQFQKEHIDLQQVIRKTNLSSEYYCFASSASAILRIAEGKVAVSFGVKDAKEKTFLQGYILGIVENLAKEYADGEAQFISVLSDVMLETSRFVLEEIHEMLIDWGPLSKKTYFQKGAQIASRDVTQIVVNLRQGIEPNPSGLLLYKKFNAEQQLVSSL